MAAALRRVRGVSSASADRRGAIVYRDPRTCSDQSLIDAVRRAGYSARIARADRCRIRVDMTCDGCSRRVSSALLRVRGVRALALESQRYAKVTFDPGRTSETELVRALRGAGFPKARLVEDSPSPGLASAR